MSKIPPIIIDRHTRKILQNINYEAAMKYGADLMSTVRPFAEEKASLEAGMKKTDRRGRNILAKILGEEGNKFDAVRQEVNEEAAKNIEREVEGRIRDAIKKGKIKLVPPPEPKKEKIRI